MEKQTETAAKKWHYHNRQRFQRDAKRIGHRLSLAMAEEEDALLWSKYKAVLDKWREFELSIGNEKLIAPLRRTDFRKPVFDEVYLQMTRQLKELYAQLNSSHSSDERHKIKEQIKALQQQRQEAASYMLRDE